MEGNEEKEIILTSPMALEGGLEEELKLPNILQQIFNLFRNVRPGSDLTYFHLPASFNLPKSQLQCYGESVYCIGEDYLSKCNKGEDKVERFTSVVAWSISTTRPLIFGQAPFNPILGETHHVSKGSLHVLLEQVSHHPPVSALHATDTKEKIEMIWSHYPVPKFQGTNVEAVIKGKRKLRLANFDENYEMDCPNLLIRFLPSTGADWHGNVHIRCKESSLHADICYYRNSAFLGFGGTSRSIKGKIFNSDSLKPIYEIHGQWDGIVTLKDVQSGETKVLYDGKKAISKLATPVVKDREKVWASESALVWSGVSRAILNMDWKRGTEEKKCIEERERKLKREGASKKEVWVAKHFTVTHNKGEWECWPLQHSVPPAPIIVPL